MTPNMRNDPYPHLPAHPAPSAVEWVGEPRIEIAPIAWGIAALIAVGILLYGAFWIGRETAVRADQDRIYRAYEKGLTLGALCKQDPTLAACSAESLVSGGVL